MTGPYIRWWDGSGLHDVDSITWWNGTEKVIPNAATWWDGTTRQPLWDGSGDEGMRYDLDNIAIDNTTDVANVVPIEDFSVSEDTLIFTIAAGVHCTIFIPIFGTTPADVLALEGKHTVSPPLFVTTGAQTNGMFIADRMYFDATVLGGSDHSIGNITLLTGQLEFESSDFDDTQTTYSGFGINIDWNDGVMGVSNTINNTTEDDLDISVTLSAGAVTFEPFGSPPATPYRSFSLGEEFTLNTDVDWGLITDDDTGATTPSDTPGFYFIALDEETALDPEYVPEGAHDGYGAIFQLISSDGSYFPSEFEDPTYIKWNRIYSEDDINSVVDNYGSVGIVLEYVSAGVEIAPGNTTEYTVVAAPDPPYRSFDVNSEFTVDPEQDCGLVVLNEDAGVLAPSDTPDLYFIALDEGTSLNPPYVPGLVAYEGYKSLFEVISSDGSYLPSDFEHPAYIVAVRTYNEDDINTIITNSEAVGLVLEYVAGGVTIQSGDTTEYAVITTPGDDGEDDPTAINRSIELEGGADIEQFNGGSPGDNATADNTIMAENAFSAPYPVFTATGNSGPGITGIDDNLNGDITTFRAISKVVDAQYVAKRYTAGWTAEDWYNVDTMYHGSFPTYAEFELALVGAYGTIEDGMASIELNVPYGEAAEIMAQAEYCPPSISWDLQLPTTFSGGSIVAYAFNYSSASGSGVYASFHTAGGHLWLTFQFGPEDEVEYDLETTNGDWVNVSLSYDQDTKEFTATIGENSETRTLDDTEATIPFYQIYTGPTQIVVDNVIIGIPTATIPIPDRIDIGH